MLNSVRTRLTIWYGGVLALSLVVFALIVYYSATRSFYARQDESLQSTAKTVASAYLQELEEEGSVAKANEVVLAQMVFPNRYVQVTDMDGRALAWSDNLAHQPLLVSSQTFNEARERGDSFATINAADSPGLRVAVVPLSNDSGKRLGFAVVAESLSVIEESSGRLRRGFYAGVPIVLLFASAGGYFLARKSLAPIAAMDRQTRRITADDLSARLYVRNSRDEIGRLATTVNALLERLQVAFEEEKRFVADASHELRTPVAVLRGEAEVALEHERTTAEYQQSLQFIKDEAESLSHIVENLFVLARQPLRQPTLARQSLSINELVGECIRAGEVLAAQKNLKLLFEDAPRSIVLSGDDDLLKRMLLNVIDNAVKYTPAGGAIEVKLTTENGSARLTVKDTGIGVPLEDQPQIFDRFYRVDKARSRTLGGAGLGLSIAKSIVELHAGAISVSSDSGGSTFTIDLPLKE